MSIAFTELHNYTKDKQKRRKKKHCLFDSLPKIRIYDLISIA